MTDPRRLLDDESSTSPTLRSLLESAKREDEPAYGRVTALATRLAPLIAPLAPLPPPPAAVATAASAGKGVLVAKIGAAIVAAGLVGSGAWVAYDRSRAAPLASPPSPVQQTLPDAPPPQPAREITPDVPTMPDVPTTPDAPTTRLALPEPRAPRHVDRDAEAALVRAAQAALLRDDAANALALTRQHATRFASGAHAEERDRIAIEALVRLGRTDDARAQAQRFFTHYPRSIYRPRIEALLP
jgi:hypothetical protein